MQIDSNINTITAKEEKLESIDIIINSILDSLNDKTYTDTNNDSIK